MSSITKDETAANDRAPQASKKLVDIKQDHLEKKEIQKNNFGFFGRALPLVIHQFREKWKLKKQNCIVNA